MQIVELLSQGLQLRTDADERLEHIGLLIHTRTIGIDHLLGGGNLKAANLHKIMNQANLLNILLRILADFRRSADFRLQESVYWRTFDGPLTFGFRKVNSCSQ